eukprot:scaffold104687_cov33-Attheya_sp.AAC.1
MDGISRCGLLLRLEPWSGRLFRNGWMVVEIYPDISSPHAAFWVMPCHSVVRGETRTRRMPKKIMGTTMITLRVSTNPAVVIRSCPTTNTIAMMETCCPACISWWRPWCSCSASVPSMWSR